MLYLVLVGVVIAATARADIFGPSDLEKALAQTSIAVEGMILNRDDLIAFYAARNNRLAWNLSGWNRTRDLPEFLNSLERVITYHGLRREDYPIDLARKLAGMPEEDNQLKLELLTTDILLKLAHDLHGDRRRLDQLYAGWEFRRSDANIPADLSTAVSDHNVDTYIDGLAPKNPAYKQLAQALGSYRSKDEQGWLRIDSGPTLRPKDHHPRVAQLRARLQAEDYVTHVPLPEKEEFLFDEELRMGIQAYQLRNGLKPDGHVGAKTLHALNVPLADRIEQIRANMERWRHMPDDFPPERYVVVNIAAQSVVFTENGAPVYQGPVIIGKPDRKTPFIQSAIRSMIVNPAWHVPAKIARKDILPKLRQDPHYLEKLGFVIKGNEEDPYGETIDWASMPEREFNFRLRQSPGDMNSLGHLKFDFDNDFAVYMHGTPHPELFEKEERTFSSGCIRLRDPEKVAEILLAGNKDPWDIPRIQEEIQTGKTHWVGIARPMPLYVLYWTVFFDGAGAVNFREDIYNYDRILTQNLRVESKVDKAA